MIEGGLDGSSAHESCEVESSPPAATPKSGGPGGESAPRGQVPIPNRGGYCGHFVVVVSCVEGGVVFLNPDGSVGKSTSGAGAVAVSRAAGITGAASRMGSPIVESRRGWFFMSETVFEQARKASGTDEVKR